MDLFGTLELLGVVQEGGQAPSFLRDTFFSNVQEHDTAKIALDYESEGRRMAPFLSGQVAGKVIERGTFSTSTFEAPYVREKFVTNAEDFIKKRLSGEAPTGALAPEQRAAIQLGKDLGIQDRAITRREEFMVSKLLFGGSCPIKGDGIDAELTFWDSSDSGAPYLALASGARWNEDTANIYADLRNAQFRAIKTGAMPDTAVLALDAADALLNNAKLQKLLDNKGIELGRIKPEHLADGAMYIGTVTALGLDLFTYAGQYEADGTGALTDYVPAKHVLLGRRGVGAPTSMNYGVVAVGDEQKNEIEYIVGRRVPESWVNRAPAGRFLQTSARPLPIIEKVGAFQVLKVLA